MSEPLLSIGNHHAPACGDPPIVNGRDPSLYVGYFENEYGEQWVFTYHRETKIAELRGGDVGWTKVFEVVDGRAEIVLNAGESAWLQACWRAATRT
jgi:hypothetical protein